MNGVDVTLLWHRVFELIYFESTLIWINPVWNGLLFRLYKFPVRESIITSPGKYVELSAAF